MEEEFTFKARKDMERQAKFKAQIASLLRLCKWLNLKKITCL